MNTTYFNESNHNNIVITYAESKWVETSRHLFIRSSLGTSNVKISSLVYQANHSRNMVKKALIAQECTQDFD